MSRSYDLMMDDLEQRLKSELDRRDISNDEYEWCVGLGMNNAEKFLNSLLDKLDDQRRDATERDINELGTNLARTVLKELEKEVNKRERGRDRNYRSDRDNRGRYDRDDRNRSYQDRGPSTGSGYGSAGRYGRSSDNYHSRKDETAKTEKPKTKNISVNPKHRGICVKPKITNTPELSASAEMRTSDLITAYTNGYREADERCSVIKENNQTEHIVNVRFSRPVELNKIRNATLVPTRDANGSNNVIFNCVVPQMKKLPVYISDSDFNDLRDECRAFSHDVQSIVGPDSCRPFTIMFKEVIDEFIQNYLQRVTCTELLCPLFGFENVTSAYKWIVASPSNVQENDEISSSLSQFKSSNKFKSMGKRLIHLQNEFEAWLDGLAYYNSDVSDDLSSIIEFESDTMIRVGDGYVAIGDYNNLTEEQRTAVLVYLKTQTYYTEDCRVLMNSHKAFDKEIDKLYGFASSDDNTLFRYLCAYITTVDTGEKHARGTSTMLSKIHYVNSQGIYNVNFQTYEQAMSADGKRPSFSIDNFSLILIKN